MKNSPNIVLIHGNGGGTASDFWIPETAAKLKELGYGITAETFPDNNAARESVWIPFLENHIKANEHTIIIGHSSGAVAAMRYAENHKLYASVLIGACYTDLGDEMEKNSGYYNRPWQWVKIKKNQNWVMQFASTDDPYIPIEEPRFIHGQLETTYYEYSDKGHFMVPHFPELLDKLLLKLENESNG